MRPVTAPTKDVHPVIVSAATIACGFMRSIAIKPYPPKFRRRELGLLGSCRNPPVIRCQVFREKGVGTMPTIVIGGFVPNATETVEFQRPLLRKYGNIYLRRLALATSNDEKLIILKHMYADPIMLDMMKKDKQ